MILNDSLFNFGRYTRASTKCIIELVIELFHTYEIWCAFCGDIVSALLKLSTRHGKPKMDKETEPHLLQLAPKKMLQRT